MRGRSSASSLARAGSSTTRLIELGCRLARALGLDTEGIVFDSLDDGLRDAGLVAVERHDFDLPVGEWGGQIGSMLASDLRSAFTRLSALYESRGNISSEDGRQLVTDAMAECERLHSGFAMAIAFGRKPDPN